MPKKAENWKNKRAAAGQKAISWRIPAPLHDRLLKFVADHNTTQAAVFRTAIEEFMDQNKRTRTPKTSSIFD